MAEPLKNKFGFDVAQRIANSILAVSKGFNSALFLKEVKLGYDDLNLMQRAWKIADSLNNHLPRNYEKAIKILLKSIGPKLELLNDSGMGSFIFLPHVFYVARYGIEHFEESMNAQYELTKRFTAEFSIRSYLERYPEATLKRLKLWSKDPNPHVRRLVSEGTRPRLPWAQRLKQFQKNPQPVLELLELLKDDPELYVRRSVANNLNDIGKDNPEILASTASKWLKGASTERKWVVNHAIRSAIKRGDKKIFEILGYKDELNVLIENVAILPKQAQIGDSIRVTFDLKNNSAKRQRGIIDFRIHYIKSNNKPSPKVFKLKAFELPPNKTITLSKKISLKEMRTRKHYPGIHHIDLILNGRIQQLGKFNLI